MTFYLDHISYDNVNDLIAGIELHHPDTDVSIELYLMYSRSDPHAEENGSFSHSLFDHVRGGVHDLAMAFIDHWTDNGTDARISDEGTTQ